MSHSNRPTSYIFLSHYSPTRHHLFPTPEPESVVTGPPILTPILTRFGLSRYIPEFQSDSLVSTLGSPSPWCRDPRVFLLRLHLYLCPNLFVRRGLPEGLQTRRPPPIRVERVDRSRVHTLNTPNHTLLLRRKTSFFGFFTTRFMILHFEKDKKVPERVLNREGVEQYH